jgi:transcriptional regulator GlxA family with amidase domain
LPLIAFVDLLSSKLFSKANDGRWSKSMIVGIPVYNDVDLLDVTAPFEILKWMDPKIDIRLIAPKPAKITARNGGFCFDAPYGFDDVPELDVLWVPGGDPKALKRIMSGPDGGYLKFMQDRATNAKWVCSVCEGALLLAKANLLNGYECTTHWYFIPCLKQIGSPRVVEGFPRFVVDRNRLTGGGVSSGLDESLKLVELLTDYKTAQGVQQNIQYYPCPPVASTIEPVDTCQFTF